MKCHDISISLLGYDMITNWVTSSAAFQSSETSASTSDHCPAVTGRPPSHIWFSIWCDVIIISGGSGAVADGSTTVCARSFSHFMALPSSTVMQSFPQCYGPGSVTAAYSNSLVMSVKHEFTSLTRTWRLPYQFFPRNNVHITVMFTLL